MSIDIHPGLPVGLAHHCRIHELMAEWGSRKDADAKGRRGLGEATYEMLENVASLRLERSGREVHDVDGAAAIGSHHLN